MSHILKTRGEGLKQENFIHISRTALQNVSIKLHVIWSISSKLYFMVNIIQPILYTVHIGRAMAKTFQIHSLNENLKSLKSISY